jgi:glutathione peroxidase-family protein
MKKIFLSFSAICLTILLHAQNSPVDEMFNKYSEKSGFTVVSISSKMFSMFANKDAENKNADDVINKLKSIKILSVEDSLLNKNLNFYSELSRKLDMSAYEELMVVKEGPNVTKFLIRQKGNIISELLVITGGPGGNSLISIKGELNLKTISELSKDIDIQELKSLDKIEKKSPEN